MIQMEKKFDDFFFIGAVPIDFNEDVPNYKWITKIDFNDLMINGHPKKNEMMREYNLKNFYFDNILFFNEINKFLGKKGFYELFDFESDIKKYTENKFKQILIKFNDQFITPKYDIGFINSIKSKFLNDIPNNLIGKILEILNKKYPIKRIGIVPNLDEHWKGGSHWVSLFANLETGQIYYYDSYGYRPNKRIRTYVKLIAEWKYKNDTGNKLDINVEEYMKGNQKPKNTIENKYDIQYNQLRNQFKGSECGVYSMNFIIRLLHGVNFDEIAKNKILDDTINKCRERYFYNQDIKTSVEEFNIINTGKGIKIKRGNGYICD
jgi:hypothetical protein